MILSLLLIESFAFSSLSLCFDSVVSINIQIFVLDMMHGLFLVLLMQIFMWLHRDTLLYVNHVLYILYKSHCDYINGVMYEKWMNYQYIHFSLFFHNFFNFIWKIEKILQFVIWFTIWYNSTPQTICNTIHNLTTMVNILIVLLAILNENNIENLSRYSPKISTQIR